MRYITDEYEVDRVKFFLEEAAKEAIKSKCRKSQRGAVIADEVGNLIGKGHNMPTILDMCCLREKVYDNGQIERCTAIHAEQMAILDALSRRRDLKGLTLYHIKVKNGTAMASGQPSCTICSRFAWFVGVKVVLWHAEGYALYQPEEFNRLSFEYFTKGK